MAQSKNIALKCTFVHPFLFYFNFNRYESNHRFELNQPIPSETSEKYKIKLFYFLIIYGRYSSEEPPLKTF